MFLVRWLKRLWGFKRTANASTKSWETATSSGRHFWQSKEWRAGVLTLVGVILAVAAGEIPLSLESLQEYIPVLILVAGGIFAMFQGAGRTRLERELSEIRAEQRRQEGQYVTIGRGETLPESEKGAGG